MSFYHDFLKNIGPKQGVYKWVPNDTAELFKKNKQAAQALGWTEDSITYVIDEYGFRNESIPNKTDTYDLYLGCSHTFGIGVNRPWPVNINTYTGNKMYNAARPGAGIDGCYRNLVYLVKQGYKFDNVFMLCPDESRVEFWDSFEGRWMTIAWWSHYKKSIIKAFNEPYYAQLNFEKTLDAIRGICLANELTLHYLTSDDVDEYIVEDKTARDLEHCGEHTHRIIASKFIKLYDNNK